MILLWDEEGRLVAAARRGDRRAFDTLVGRHGALLRGYLRRRVGPDAAEDVWQETWVAAWASFPRYERLAGFKAWLMSIALNKVQGHHRKHAQRKPAHTLAQVAAAARLATAGRLALAVLLILSLLGTVPGLTGSLHPRPPLAAPTGNCRPDLPSDRCR